MPSSFLLPTYAAVHATGKHCGSTAMGNLLRYHTGTTLSEAAVLGLSGAIWFCAVWPPLVPRTIAFGRTITLETGICEHLGLPYAEQPADDDEAWPLARAALHDGSPVVLMGDSSRLDYFGGPPFPGHRFLLVGYDEAAGVAIVGDRKWRELQQVSFESLARARSIPDDLLSAQNLWGAPLEPWPGAAEIEQRAGQAARLAVRTAAERMLDPDGDATGVRGMRTFAEQIGGLSDRQLTRLAATNEFVIERGGNGGGLFRLLYASFLRELAPALGEGAPRLADEFGALAAAWTALAALLADTADHPTPREHAGEITRTLEALADGEEQAWSRALDLAG